MTTPIEPGSCARKLPCGGTRPSSVQTTASHQRPNSRLIFVTGYPQLADVIGQLLATLDQAGGTRTCCFRGTVATSGCSTLSIGLPGRSGVADQSQSGP